MENLERKESPQLIAADKVKGTEVYNASDENLGTVEEVMIDNRSGKVAYAVMSFGGFLGIGEKYHPLPWGMLQYDPAKRSIIPTRRGTPGFTIITTCPTA